MFETPSKKDICNGKISDHCNLLSLLTLEKIHKENSIICLEAHVSNFPNEIEKAHFFGLHDFIRLLKGKDVQVYSIEPGHEFFENEPVINLIGYAKDLAMIKSTLTGILAFHSTVVTKCAHLKKIAGNKPIYFFGLRKLHPSHIMQYLEATYAGGFEINATDLAKQIDPNLEISDCQEHVSNIIADDLIESWRAFIKISEQYGGIYIVLDNFSDTVTEAKFAIEKFKHEIKGFLVDTSRTRRGDIVQILKELKWYLNLYSKKEVKIGLTGGVDSNIIKNTKDILSSFGVGLNIVSGYIFDFSFQIVEVDSKPKSKIGVFPGRKNVYYCKNCGKRDVDIDRDVYKKMCCNNEMEKLLKIVDLTSTKENIDYIMESRNYILSLV